MKSFSASDGRKLAFRDTGGDKPAVVCLAGLTRNGRDFEEVSEFLSPDFRVIRLDSRGRGQSEYAQDPLAEYMIPIETRDAVELIQHLGLKRVALIGTSRGGIISMAIASAYHSLVSAIVLNDVGAHVEGRGLLRILAILGRQPKASTFAEAAKHLQETNRRQFPEITIDAWEHHARCIYAEVAGRPVLDYDTHLRSAVAAAIDFGEPGVSLWPLFESLAETPLLVIHGELSDVLLHETVEKMRSVHDGMQVLQVPKQGHAPFLDAPETLQSIHQFLKANRAPARSETTEESQTS